MRHLRVVIIPESWPDGNRQRLERFGSLARAAGWRIAAHRDGPMHQVVRLETGGPAA